MHWRRYTELRGTDTYTRHSRESVERQQDVSPILQAKWGRGGKGHERDGFSEMTPPDRLCQHWADVDNVDLVCRLELLVLRDRIGNDHSLHPRVLDNLGGRKRSDLY